MNDHLRTALGMTRGALHAAVFLLILSLGLFGANLLFTGREVNVLRGAVQAECRFDADLGTAPVIPARGIRPSRLGVTIISDSRIAWYGLGCPGVLPPPDRSFSRWARYYRLPAS